MSNAVEEQVETMPEPAEKPGVAGVFRSRRIQIHELDEIMTILGKRHSVFSQFWMMSKPVFSNSVPTAAVAFDKAGKCFSFVFNPKYWDELEDNYSRAFVIAHECLHVLLNHGKRAGDEFNMIKNMAMDISINHGLIENFDFKRNLIKTAEHLCWKDKYECLKDEVFEPTRNFEYYYAIMKDDAHCERRMLADSHDWMQDMSIEDIKKALTKIGMNLSEKEIEDLKKKMGRHAGTGKGEQGFILEYAPIFKKKWETIIRNWAKKFDPKVEISWYRKNKRYSMLPKELDMPFEFLQTIEKKAKIKVWFGLDTSGSCWDLKDRFFKAASSLNPEVFDLKLFCFDTACYATTLQSGEVFGGGGTAFDIIEDYMLEQERETGKYPHKLFLVTDGYGNPVSPKYPECWTWILTEHSSTSYIPAESEIFKLDDFE